MGFHSKRPRLISSEAVAAVGKIPLLVSYFYERYRCNPVLAEFIRHYYPMLYKDPTVEPTVVSWYASKSNSDSIVQGIAELPTDYVTRIQNFLIEYLGPPNRPRAQ
jgi:hypothetical protein